MPAARQSAKGRACRCWSSGQGGGALRVVGNPMPQSRGCSDTRRTDRLTNATTVQPLTIPSR